MARITIGAGMWREGNRLFAEVRIGNSRGGQGRVQQTFPIGTSVEILRAWQHTERGKLLRAGPIPIERGSLAADIPRFLETLPAGSYRYDSAQILAHWATSPLGTSPRAFITRLDVIAQIARWGDAGAAVGTCNRRLSRLRKLYQTLDGDPMAPNPTMGITFQREPEREPRDLPTGVVQFILDALPDVGRAELGGTRPTVSATKLRLQVMAWTGMAGATLRRMRPRDLDLAHGRIYLRPRRKGKGSDGAWVALLPEAVDALRAFVDAGLCGIPWSRSSMRKTWHVGITRATKAAARMAETGDTAWADALATLPPHCKPYDLRHSFASEIYRRTGDILAVSELLQHADMETTKRYTKGAVSERVTAAIAAVAKAHAAMPRNPLAAAKARRGLRLVPRG